MSRKANIRRVELPFPLGANVRITVARGKLTGIVVGYRLSMGNFPDQAVRMDPEVLVVDSSGEPKTITVRRIAVEAHEEEPSP